MNRSAVLAVVGFFIGGSLTCYFEWKSRIPGSARASEAEAPADGRESEIAREQESDRAESARRARGVAARRTAPGFPFHVRLKQVLVGGDVIAAGVLPGSTVDEHAKHDRYIVYLELSFTGYADAGWQTVSYRDLRLEDDRGLIYSPLQSRDCLSAELGPAKTASGGVAFAVYNDSAPARLLYRTGGERFTPLPENIFWDGQNAGVRP